MHMLLCFGGVPSAFLEGWSAHFPPQHWPHHRVEVIHLSLLSGPVLTAGHALGAGHWVNEAEYDRASQ